VVLPRGAGRPRLPRPAVGGRPRSRGADRGRWPLAAVLALPLLAPAPRAAADERVVLRRGPLLFSAPAEMPPRLQGMLAGAEPTLRRIAADFGTRVPERIEVRIAGSLAEFAELQPPGVRVPSWAVGVAHPREGLIVLNHGRTAAGTLAETDKVLAHELSHLLLAWAVGHRKVPRWFDEGLAVREAGEWSFWRGSTLVGPAATGRLIPLQRLAHSFPGEEQSAHLAYAQSVELVSWLIEAHGTAGLQRLLAMLRGGREFFESLEAVSGQRIDALERDWRAHLKLRFHWLPLLTSASVIWMLGAVVFLLAYLRRRRQRRAQLAALAAEEEALERAILGAEAAEALAPEHRAPPGVTIH